MVNFVQTRFRADVTLIVGPRDETEPASGAIGLYSWVCVPALGRGRSVMRPDFL